MADDDEERWEKRSDGTIVTYPISEMEVRMMDSEPPQLALRLKYLPGEDGRSLPVQLQLNIGPKAARTLADQLLRRADDAEARPRPALN